MRTVETVLSPRLFDQVENYQQKLVVVIDVLRATSTICSILANGAKQVIPVAEEEQAREYITKGFLVGGERGGNTIPGFHFGNSPLEYTAEKVYNKDVILTTTNGTKSISMASEANQLIIGAFLNLSSVLQFIKNSENDVVLFCAGWRDKVNYEDSLFAGAICEQLDGEFDLDDSSLLAQQSYIEAHGSLFESLQRANHFKRLAIHGVLEDIKYCCKIDELDILPIYQNGSIKALKSAQV